MIGVNSLPTSTVLSYKIWLNMSIVHFQFSKMVHGWISGRKTKSCLECRHYMAIKKALCLVGRGLWKSGLVLFQKYIFLLTFQKRILIREYSFTIRLNYY